MTQTGVCTNFGSCTKAERQEKINVPDGSDALCPECGQPLTISRGGGGGGGKLLVFGGAGAALLVLVAAMLLFLRPGHSSAPASDQSVQDQLVDVWPWLKSTP